MASGWSARPIGRRRRFGAVAGRQDGPEGRLDRFCVSPIARRSTNHRAWLEDAEAILTALDVNVRGWPVVDRGR